MFLKIMLVIIVMTADAQHYKDFVTVFDTQEECESVKTKLLKALPEKFPDDVVVFAKCARPAPFNAADI